MKYFWPILLNILLVSCGPRSSRVDYGKTTVSELLSQKGIPLDEKPIPLKEGRILQYEENQKFQVKDDIVSHGFRDPKGDEKNLLYWRHKFRECSTVTNKLEQKDSHLLAEFELRCDSLGTTVIYTEGSEFVSRIIEHAKK